MEQMDMGLERQELIDLMNNTTVEVAGEEEAIASLVGDLKAAHQALDEYKSGSLTLSKALDERRMQAKDDGDEELVKLLEHVKESAFGVYLRIQRGDLELLGGREGKHSGYFE